MFLAQYFAVFFLISHLNAVTITQKLFKIMMAEESTVHQNTPIIADK
jgi:hypothetical protein